MTRLDYSLLSFYFLPYRWRVGFGIWRNAPFEISSPQTTTPHELNFANFEWNYIEPLNFGIFVFLPFLRDSIIESSAYCCAVFLQYYTPPIQVGS